MFRTALVLAAAALFLRPAAAPAGPGVLDLLPRDAAAGVAVRNLADLQKKLDKLIRDVEPNTPVGAGQMFAMLYQQLGIQNGLDEDNSFAAVLADPKAAGLDKFPAANPEPLLVLVVPFTDRDKMAGNFGFKKGELKPEKMGTGNGMTIGKFFYARGKHLYFGDNGKAVASVARGKPVAGVLAAGRRKALAEADVLVHVRPAGWGEEWKKVQKDLVPDWAAAGEKEEQEVVRLFAQGLGEIRHGFAAVRLEGGVGVSLLGVFPQGKDSAAGKFVKLLGGGRGAARLDGLPKGNVLAALAVGAGGSPNGLLGKVLFNALLRGAAEPKKVIAPADRPAFVGIFAEIWQRLRGSRLAVYQNADEARNGLFSVLAVLDTDDADKFIADMRELAHIADGTALDLKTRTGRGVDGPKVEALVRDLASPRYRVRQSATTRLRLLGEAALPFLDRAIKSGDVEAAQRAKRLRHEIEQAAAQRRQKVLEGGLPLVVKPTLAFVRKAETRAGCKVHVVAVKLAGKDRAAGPRLRQLFGPDWDKISLAVHGKQVVALLGSDVRVLDEALANLKAGKPGLAASEALAAFARQRHPSRRFEFHVSVAGVLALVKGPQANQPAPAKPGEALTSAALTLEPDQVQVDFRLAGADLRAMVREGVSR